MARKRGAPRGYARGVDEWATPPERAEFVGHSALVGRVESRVRSPRPRWAGGAVHPEAMRGVLINGANPPDRAGFVGNPALVGRVEKRVRFPRPRLAGGAVHPAAMRGVLMYGATPPDRTEFVGHPALVGSVEKRISPPARDGQEARCIPRLCAGC